MAHRNNVGVSEHDYTDLIGTEGRKEVVIDESLITRHVGGAGVFATPSMILLMENTCHGSVAGLIPPGHTTVGYEVHVFHKAPAAPGSSVVVSSRLVAAQGRRLTFEVACRQGDVLIGEGVHRRAVIPALDQA